MNVLVICPSQCIAKVIDGNCLCAKFFHKCLNPQFHPNLQMYVVIARMMKLPDNSTEEKT